MSVVTIIIVIDITLSGSTTSVQSTASSNLAAALIDSHQGRSGLRSSSAASSDNRANRGD